MRNLDLTSPFMSRNINDILKLEKSKSYKKKIKILLNKIMFQVFHVYELMVMGSIKEGYISFLEIDLFYFLKNVDRDQFHLDIL